MLQYATLQPTKLVDLCATVTVLDDLIEAIGDWDITPFLTKTAGTLNLSDVSNFRHHSIASASRIPHIHLPHILGAEVNTAKPN